MSSDALARAMFALLVLATVAAFFVTQRLKSGEPVVKRLALQRYVSPNGDGRKDRARISFVLPKGDSVTVDMLNSAGDRVRRLVDNVHLARGRHALSWNGRADDGPVVHDGEYFVRVVLRAEGRAATSRRGILVIDSPPRPRLLAVTPSRVAARHPGPFTFRFTGPAAAQPVFRIWRTGGRRAVQVATLVGRRRHHDVRWSGLIGTRPVPPGDYAVSVTVSNRALVPGSAPPRLPPTAAEATPGTGFEVVGTTAVAPLEPVRAGAVVRIPVQGGGRHLRFTVSRLGSSRPLRRGRAVGAVLALRVPPRTATGEYVVRVVSAGRPAQVPLTVAGRGSSPVLVVLPAIAWQGANPVDDDADGFPNTLFETPSIPLGRPFAEGRLPSGLTRQAGPLLDFLQRRRLRFELTTDLALARGRGARLAGHRGVLLAGDETWTPAGLGAALRAYAEAGGRIASFGGDSLLRRVTLTPTALTGATPREPADVFGEAIAPGPPGPPAPLVASADAIGLFAGTNGVVGSFARVEQSQRLPPGARSLAAAGRDPRHPALVAYGLGHGTVIRVGAPDWAGSLASSPQVAAVTARAWSIISR